MWAATAQAAATVSPLYAVEGHPFATLAAQMLQIYLNVTAKGCSYPLALGPTGVHSLETQVLLASQTSDCSIMGGQAMSAYSWDDLGLKKRITNQQMRSDPNAAFSLADLFLDVDAADTSPSFNPDSSYYTGTLNSTDIICFFPPLRVLRALARTRTSECDAKGRQSF